MSASFSVNCDIVEMTHFAVKELIRKVGLKKLLLLRQVWAMSAIFFSTLSTGILQSPPIPEDLDSEHSTSLLAYYTIASIVGCIASSILMDQIGRKLTFILGTLPGIVGCFLVSLPDSSTANTLRMTFGGLSTGFTVILGTIVIGEYASPEHRGVLLNLVTTSMNMGRTISLILRPNNHWQLALTAFLLQIVSLGIATTWPESPYWLALKEQFEKSEITFQWLRNTTCKKELADFAPLLRTKVPLFERTVNLLKKYSSREFLRPVTVVVFGVILMESSGRHLASSSLVQTIGVDYDTFKILTSSIISLSSIVTLILVLILRHRTQLLISGCLATLVLFLSSGYVFLVSNHIIGDISWLSSLLIVLQLVFSNLGSTSIPLALIGEVFPINYKAAGSLVSGLLISVSSWVVIKSNPYLLSVLNCQGMLALFGTLMTISLLVLFIILPETKHKSLLEIEEYFNDERDINDKISDDKVRLTSEYYTETGTIPLF